VKSKKRGTRASARQPKDSVPGDGVQQYLINGTEFTSIDFWDWLQNCHGLAEGT